jgi:hypothetical protein
MEAKITVTLAAAPHAPHPVKVREWDGQLVDVLYGLLSDRGSEHSEGKRLGTSFVFAIKALRLEEYEVLLAMRGADCIRHALLLLDDATLQPREMFEETRKLFRPHPNVKQCLLVSSGYNPSSLLIQVLGVITLAGHKSMSYLHESVSIEEAQARRRQPTFLSANAHMHVGQRVNGGIEKVHNYARTFSNYGEYLSSYRTGGDMKHSRQGDRPERPSGLKRRVEGGERSTRATTTSRTPEEAPYKILRELIQNTKDVLADNRRLRDALQDTMERHNSPRNSSCSSQIYEKVLRQLQESTAAADEWSDTAENLDASVSQFFDDQKMADLLHQYVRLGREVPLAPAPVTKFDLLHRTLTEVIRVAKQYADPESKRLWKEYILPIWQEEDLDMEIPPLPMADCVEIASSGEISFRALLYRLLCGPSKLLYGPSDAPLATRLSFLAQWQKDARALLRQEKRKAEKKAATENERKKRKVSSSSSLSSYSYYSSDEDQEDTKKKS